MLAGIRTFISNYTNGMYFPHIQIIDIIEILIITVIVYEIMLWIKKYKKHGCCYAASLCLVRLFL